MVKRYKLEYIDRWFDLERPAAEIVKDLQEAIDDWGEDYVEVIFEDDYDESGSYALVRKRPETKEEASERIARDSALKQKHDARERQDYERLKKRFEE